MSKRLILILALAFVVGIAFAAYAEVQNVKVSGDLNVLGVYRNNLDLAKERPTDPVDNNLITKSDKIKNTLSIVRVRIDADLTDNVSTTVRLINERDWDAEDTSNTVIDLDLAYATMKEFIYSPVTLTIGRQELHFGNDMIVGDPDTNGIAAKGFGVVAPYTQGDLSSRKAFDAVKATLNYDPLVIDAVWAKVSEGTNTLNDDATLYGVNANYKLRPDTTLEAYGFAKIKDSNTAAVSATTFVPKQTKADTVYTLGGRVVNTTVKNLTAQLESAFQFGTYNPAQDINATSTDMKAKRRRQAWALEALATYDLKDIAGKVSKKISDTSPSLTAAYVYLSGDNRAQTAAGEDSGNKWYGWDAMYENQTFGHILNAIMGFTNTNLVGLNGKMQPLTDLSVNIDYVYAWLAKAYKADTSALNLKGVSGANTYKMTRNRRIGQEVDVKLTYDYTEDVQFGLLGGVFFPGSAFENKDASNFNRSAASEVIGSMKVTF